MRAFPCFKASVLALAAFMLATSVSDAFPRRRNRWYNGYSDSYYYSYPATSDYYYYYSYYPETDYAPAATVTDQDQPAQAVQVSPPASAPARSQTQPAPVPPKRVTLPQPRPASTTATVDVITPFNAHIWMQGMEVSQSGMRHHFVSPPLQSGQSYQYEVRAQWRQGGQNISRTRQVIVRPGSHMTVDFTQPQTQGY